MVNMENQHPLLILPRWNLQVRNLFSHCDGLCCLNTISLVRVYICTYTYFFCQLDTS